jgi:hypothetical protein
MSANPNLLMVGLSITIQREFHPVTMIQSATQLDKLGDFFAARLASSLKSAYPVYLPMDDACGFIISILSGGQAKKAQLIFNSHDILNHFLEVSDIGEAGPNHPPDDPAFKLQMSPPHLSTTQQGEDFKPASFGGGPIVHGL